MNREISLELKRTYLDKLLSSTTFARAEQLRRLFRWLGMRAIQEAPPPTEHEVARDALGRGDEFDPQTDSLVRKEMTRLRAKLKQYYEGEGRRDIIRFRNEDGYRMQIQWSSPSISDLKPSDLAVCLLVLPILSTSEEQSEAMYFYEELLIHLCALERVEVIAPSTARLYGSRQGDARDFAAETSADYLLEGSLRRKQENLQISIWLVNGQSGRAKHVFKLAGTSTEDLASSLSRSIESCLDGRK